MYYPFFLRNKTATATNSPVSINATAVFFKKPGNREPTSDVLARVSANAADTSIINKNRNNP